MKNFALNSLIVTIANATVHLANYVVVAGIAAFFGATWQTDAFFLSFAFPTFFVGAIVSAVGSVFIPIFAECRISRPQVLGQLIGSALLYAFAGTLLIASLIFLAAVYLFDWIPFANATLEFRQLVIQQTLLMSPVIVIQTLTGILSAFYNANGRFLIPPATDAISTLAVLVVIVISKSTIGIFSVPLGFVVGAVLHLLLLAAFWFRFRIQVIWTWKMDTELRRSLGLSLPLILGTAALQLGTLITRFLAAQLPEGSVTILDYANRISYGVMELLTSGILLVVLAKWSHDFAKEDAVSISGQVQRVALMMSFIVVPLIGMAIILRQPLVAIAFQRGSFDPATTAATARVLLFFLLGIPIDAIGRIYVRLFLVWQNTWVVGGLAIARVAFTALTTLLLMQVMGVSGVALADTLAILLITVALVYLANRKLGNTFAGIGTSLLKVGISTLCAGGTAALVSIFLRESQLAMLLVGGITGSIIYVLSSWMMGNEQLRNLMALLIPRLVGRSS